MLNVLRLILRIQPRSDSKMQHSLKTGANRQLPAGQVLGYAILIYDFDGKDSGSRGREGPS